MSDDDVERLSPEIASALAAVARMREQRDALLAACERALEQLVEVNPTPVRTVEALRAAIARARGGA